MSEQKESSVLFSLKELMNLEEDRIRGEEDAKANKMAAEEEARRSAERAARDAEEARIRAEEERRRAEEQRSREEAARLEAIRVAEIERARMEAEGQARMAAMNSQQQHLLQMEAIRGDSGKKRLRNILIGTVAAVIMIGGTTAYLVNENIKKNELEQQRAAADVKAAEDKVAKLESQQAEQAAKVKGLEDAVTQEKDEGKKRLLQAKLDAAKQEEADTAAQLGKPSFRGKTGTPTTSTAKAVCTCKSTDPLCDCL